MPDPDLAAIRARLKNATPGPWHVATPPARDAFTSVWYHPNPVISRRICSTAERMPESEHMARAEADAELIASAPADISALLAHVDRLTAEVERLRDELASAIFVGCAHCGAYLSARRYRSRRGFECCSIACQAADDERERLRIGRLLGVSEEE